MFVVSCGGVSQQGDPDAAPPDASDDPCLTNTCECDVDADCEDFEVCDTTSTPGRICTCAPTYEDNGGGACAFAGAPADPGFQATDVWIPTNAANATFDPGNPGGSDLGVGILSSVGQCNLEQFSQTFNMPPRDRAQQFVVDVNYRHVDPNFNFPFIPARVQIGDSWYAELPSQDQFAQRTFCLGESAYGGDVTFRVGPNNRDFQCPNNSAVTFEMDRFAIRPAMAGECPEETGRPNNGDMEDTDGWTLATTGDGTAAFVPNVGNGGSQGIQFTTTTRCSGGSATAPISIPSSFANPAIEFFAGGNTNNILEMRLDNKVVSRAFPTNGVRRVCVPNYAIGTVTDVMFQLRRLPFGADCSIPRARSAVIDDVVVVDEPGCGDDPQEYDNGFETFFADPGLTPGWSATDDPVNTFLAIAEIDNNQGQANSGFGSLHLRTNNRCNGSFAEREITVPQPAGAEGPAVKVFINAPSMPIGEAGLSLQTGVFTESLAAEGVGYQETVLCIPPFLAGRPATVRLFADGGGGGCTQSIPNENAFFDDVTVGTDASCPAN